MQTLARIGCLARSVLYFLVGVLALLVALGSSYGDTTDEGGAMRRIDQVFGHIVLIVLACGLFCYAAWRFFQSVQDHDGYGNGLKGLGVRLAQMVSGLVHFGLGIYALVIVFGSTHPASWATERLMAKWLLLQPFGRYILAVTGISVIVTGIVQYVRAANGSFLRDILLPVISKPWLKQVCRFGFVARGSVFILIGVFFLNSAWKARSREVGGLHKALETMRQLQHGAMLLGAVAIGFMAFAVFAFIEGFYHREIRVTPRKS